MERSKDNCVHGGCQYGRSCDDCEDYKYDIERDYAMQKVSKGYSKKKDDWVVTINGIDTVCFSKDQAKRFKELHEPMFEGKIRKG